MSRHLITLTVLALLLNTVDAKAETAVRDTSDAGSAIYETLRGGDFLEDYMIDEVGEIAGTIVTAANRWAGYGANRPYVKDFMNIYLVNTQRLPEANVLEQFSVELSRYGVSGNALAHEETGTLFVDTVLLKSLITTVQLFSESGYSTVVAVGAVKARGVNAFRSFWDPTLNPTLNIAEYTDKWAMLSAGALAFILAHERGISLWALKMCPSGEPLLGLQARKIKISIGCVRTLSIKSIASNSSLSRKRTTSQFLLSARCYSPPGL